ncbi:MAG: 3-isopropylmalate dehydrogenase, partial [Bacillota bacterium]|nr:3-isopropylmalate dehydrogenase [Bacillota bacterium]
MYESVMDIIVRANEDKFEEAKSMCEALEELMKEELEAKRAEGEEIGKERGKEIGKQQALNRVNMLNLKLAEL